MTMKAHDFSALVAALPEEDFTLLASCVRARAERPVRPRAEPPLEAGVKHADSEELAKLEEAFAARVLIARNAQQRLSRLRLWLVFVLLRHGGLRLSEALQCDDREDVDLARALVRVNGPYARDVPLPPAALAIAQEVLQAPECQSLRGTLTHLDEGYLRRSFYARARECEIDPGLASARALRNARAIELCRQGMPPHIAQAFLGRQAQDQSAALVHYPEEDVRTLIHYYLHRGMKMKTSARNVFPGRISALRRSGILVEVVLTTFTGLTVVAIITDESCKTLSLAEGRTAIATVKAPWVIVEKGHALKVGVGADAGGGAEGRVEASDGAGKSSARNRFLGRVTSVRGDAVAREVVVELAEGSRVCALITADSAEGLELCEGDEAWVSFKAFAVVLTLE